MKNEKSWKHNSARQTKSKKWYNMPVHIYVDNSTGKLHHLESKND